MNNEIGWIKPMKIILNSTDWSTEQLLTINSNCFYD